MKEVLNGCFVLAEERVPSARNECTVVKTQRDDRCQGIRPHRTVGEHPQNLEFTHSFALKFHSGLKLRSKMGVLLMEEPSTSTVT
jgi:hypothetical protein